MSGYSELNGVTAEKLVQFNNCIYMYRGRERERERETQKCIQTSTYKRPA
jgi:hypothetical protein